MKLCNTINRISGNNCKISHLNLSVIDNSHLTNLLLVARIFSLNLFYKTTVNLFNNLVNSWKKS